MDNVAWSNKRIGVRLEHSKQVNVMQTRNDESPVSSRRLTHVRWRIRGLLLAIAISMAGLGASEVTLPPSSEVAALFSRIGNGGFEEGTETPEFWSRHPGKDEGRNRHSRDTSTAFSGQASGRIDWFDEISGPNKAALQWNRYSLPLTDRGSLLVGGFVRTNGVPGARLGVHFYAEERKHLGFEKTPARTRNDDAWTPFVGELPIPDGTTNMGVALYSKEGGTTWYDDVVVLGVPRARAAVGTPNVDGTLTDPCWRAAALPGSFVQQDGSALAEGGTRSWVCCDSGQLYLAFDCVKATGASRGSGDISEGIVLLLDPGQTFVASYRITVSPDGQYTATRAEDDAWAPKLQVATTRGLKGWSAEIAVPFEALDLSLATGDLWGLNVVRHDASRQEVTTWSLGGVSNPRRFGSVTLETDMGDVLRASAQRAAVELGSSRRALLAEIEKVGVSAEDSPSTFELLGAAKAAADGLRKSGLGKPGTEPDRLALREKAAEAREALALARRTASQSLFPSPAVPQRNGFTLAIVPSLQKVRRDGVVQGGLLADAIRLDAAQDESESVQLVVVPADRALSGVSVSVSPLTNGEDTIEVSPYRVEYVETGPTTRYSQAYVGWWPDVLLPPAPFNVPAGRKQPIWLRVDVPPGAVPGVYRGNVRVEHAGDAVTVPMELRVRPFRLPRPGTLPCAFGLYASVLAEWYFGKKPYSSVMPIETFVRWCEFMGDYRLTPKNIAREYQQRGKGADGSETLDLSALQGTVGRLAPDYFPPNSFCVARLPCPKEVREGTTKQDPRTWVASLERQTAEFARLGLPRQAYIYGIDEPITEAYPFVRSVYELVRQAAPDYPLLQTVNHDPPEALVGCVDIWCPLTSRLDQDAEFYRARRAAGDAVWAYVCCSPKPPYANFLIDQPAIAHRVLFWQAWQHDVSGILYWCICWWRGMPGPTSGKPHFPDAPITIKDLPWTYGDNGVNGDGILIWPGPDMTPYPSVRLEIIRDGIEDYEYLAFLRQLISRAGVEERELEAQSAQRTLARARALLRVPPTISRTFTDYCTNPALIQERRSAIGEAIEELLELLKE
ncbi:MAG: DUF4091 domain-containing protein [Lentisphaerae bacterium]|nr:DUF4091 domain-containing protein [Lentisphaerota bacterium]MBT4818844.1 DUF4091 domain-containing protein [Lentisphaerota bacterium]MBT5608873.1 DUF4091 domain-containing protein [Lentisphaerota bacterium]MBT7057277.1 DUF4091 domain-containing protein [Lentisphaerota bacterium]MBT7848473.1 DUF4091 domain-containing protein [Lentisphaerota bacterium]